MAMSSTLKVMISSRCADVFPAVGGRCLTEIRRDLKCEIEALRVFGKPVFDVWINETTPPQGGAWDSWEVCLQAVKDCDILLALYNGHAGGAKDGDEIGICHAELMTAWSLAPAKVRVLALPEIPLTEDEQGHRNQLFRDYVKQQNRFRSQTITTSDELIAAAAATLHDALISLAQDGVREANRGRFHSGHALEWHHLDFLSRQAAMRDSLRTTMLRRPGSAEDGEQVILRLDDTDVLCVTHAIPAALTVGPAREMVGQPFLRDYQLADKLIGHRGGPVHVIACHKNATETQAIRLLGFPDATVIRAPFGVFVADNVQKVQFAFLIDCTDAYNTSQRFQQFYEWLAQSGEGVLVARRASHRAHIVRAIAEVAIQ